MGCVRELWGIQAAEQVLQFDQLPYVVNNGNGEDFEVLSPSIPKLTAQTEFPSDAVSSTVISSLDQPSIQSTLIPKRIEPFDDKKSKGRAVPSLAQERKSKSTKKRTRSVKDTQRSLARHATWVRKAVGEAYNEAQGKYSLVWVYINCFIVFFLVSR